MNFSKDLQYPKVSIVIPVYNGSNYMCEAIDSALVQTYKNIEVLVINDGSTDKGASREIALNYGERIRYFEKLNGGIATALNLGIREMRGAYFSWLSHDDVYYPDKIEKQIEYLRQQDKKDIILYSDYDLIDNDSKYIRACKVQHVEPFRICLLSSWPVNGCSTLIKKSILYDIGFFDENAKYSQDYYLWFKLAKKYEFVHLPKCLIKSRIHDDQGTLMFYDEAHVEIEMMYRSFIDILFLEENIYNLTNNKEYIINGLKMKNHINLIVYFLDSLIRNQKLKKSKVTEIKIEELKYIYLIIKIKFISSLVSIKKRFFNLNL